MTTALRSPRILLVDDDATVRRLATRALHLAGFRVDEAADGLAAEVAFAECKPDLVLLDVVMPQQDGFQTCQHLRSCDDGRHTPILMMTATDDVESIHRAFEVGATDFISKPLPWALLAYRVRYMLRSAAILSELAQSEERLAASQRAAKLGHWDWHTDSDVIILSAMSQQLLGGACRGTATLAAMLDEVHVDDRERTRKALRLASTGANGLSVEFRTRDHSDSEGSCLCRFDLRLWAVPWRSRDVTWPRRSSRGVPWATPALHLRYRSALFFRSA